MSTEILKATLGKFSDMQAELDALRDSDIQLHARNEMLFSELESLRQENSRLQDTFRHMEACRFLLKTPEDDVLYSSIEALVQENSRLREALEKIVERYRIALPAPALVDDIQRIARQALNPPKRS